MTKISDLSNALQAQNVQAFLRVIRAGESHETNDEAYAALYGWRPGNGQTFDDFADHPRQAFKSPWGWTSAAGAFQAMCEVPGKVKTDTWGDFVRWCAPQRYKPLFGQEDQQLFAAWCINRRGALDDVLAGRIEQALKKCAKEWASLPGSPYGQPTISLERALEVYQRHGGQLEASPSTPTAPTDTATDTSPPTPVAPSSDPYTQEGNMPLPVAPLLIPVAKAVLPELIGAIPQLGKLFGSGSAVSERNVKALQVAGNVIMQATNAASLQEATEKVLSDPTARQAASDAVQQNWFEITVAEAGGGGIEGASKRAETYFQPGHWFWLNPSFWVSLILLTFPAMLVVDVLFVHPDNYGEQLRTQIVTAVLVVIGMVGSYWIGTSVSSARKDVKQ